MDTLVHVLVCSQHFTSHHTAPLRIAPLSTLIIYEHFIFRIADLKMISVFVFFFVFGRAWGRIRERHWICAEPIEKW